MEKPNQHIVLFDGVCNLCSHSVQFIIKHDRNARFKFASLQSEYGKEMASRFKIDSRQTDSVIYICNGRAFIKSSAALHIARRLDGGWPIVFVFIVFPPCIRNLLYDFVARYRYKWFGKMESCMVPSPELKKRFLG